MTRRTTANWSKDYPEADHGATSKTTQLATTMAVNLKRQPELPWASEELLDFNES